MKKTYSFLAFIITIVAFAQAPQGFNYQATVRNSTGDLIINQNVNFKFNIMLNSPTSLPVFSETHLAPTDDLGQVNLVIGQGTTTTGNFSSINWTNGNYYLGIELNTGNGYVAMGTTQLLSVPFALYANNAGNNTTSTPDLAIVLAQANDANNIQIKNLADPTDAQDAVTKSYLEIQLANLQQQLTNNLIAQYPAGSVFCASGPTQIVPVLNPLTGKIWMDRNLGASQVATSSTDASAFGDLYQWGRGNDGHQCRTSLTTNTLSSSDQPAHGYFITINSGNLDWRNPQNTNLWQGANGINNPCPIGYRLPTENEINLERLSWSSNNSLGGFSSPLKLPMAGGRGCSDASLGGVGSNGNYWSSTVNGVVSSSLRYFNSSSASMGSNGRADGVSVRCIKD